MSTIAHRVKELQPPVSRTILPRLRWHSGRWLPELTGVLALIDTLWLFTYGYHDNLEGLLRASGARNVQSRRLPGGWGYVYRITRPTLRTYDAMRLWTKYHREYEFWICRVALAFDFFFSNALAADAFKYEQGTYLRLRRAANNGYWYDGETRYFVDFRRKRLSKRLMRRKRRYPRRSMILYTKQNNDRRVRLEITFRNGEAVKRNRLRALHINHASINPRRRGVRHIMVREIKPTYLQKKIRQALARDNIHGCERVPGWRRLLPGRVVHAAERMAHDNPDHSLPMQVVQEPLLHSLLPTHLYTPE